MSFTRTVGLAAIALITTLTAAADAGYRSTPDFVSPTGWTASDPLATYYEWDALTTTTAAAPDVGQAGGLSGAGASAALPAFSSTSNNFYAFSGNYSVSVDAPNHGGPTGNLAGGTHVIVQLANALSGGTSVLPGTLQIVDPGGTTLAGGAPGAAIAEATLFSGSVPVPPEAGGGTTDYAEQAWEFFLPDWTGNFQVRFDNVIHSSVDRIRIDSVVVPGNEPMTATLPEPTSLALFGLGGLALLRRRRG